MSETYPEDIRAAAEAVVERGYDEGLVDAVCRALLAEREAQKERDVQAVRAWGTDCQAMIRRGS
jgi:hypothetical protein